MLLQFKGRFYASKGTSVGFLLLIYRSILNISVDFFLSLPISKMSYIVIAYFLKDTLQYL